MMDLNEQDEREFEAALERQYLWLFFREEMPALVQRYGDLVFEATMLEEDGIYNKWLREKQAEEYGV